VNRDGSRRTEGAENHRPAKGKRNIKILKTKIRKAGLQLTETKDGFMVRVDMTKDEEGKKQLDDLATLKDLHMPEGWSGSIGWGSNACMVAEFRRTE
jgi:hypothetical protein